MSDARKTLPERPVLKPKCRLKWDDVRGQDILLYPEGVLLLNPTGRRILDLLDGRTVGQVVDDLEEEYGVEDIEGDVREFLEGVAGKGLLTDA